jgi:predicted dehydrogenase
VAKPFRVGFIGAGGIARHHMGLLKKIDDVEIVAAADVSEPALAKVKDEFGVARTYADYKQLLKEAKDLDAIDVCTPNGLHAVNTIAALEAGKHVLVEKPMAMNAREAQQMADAARKAGKQLVIGFQYRFAPRSQLIHQQVSAGQFGNVMYVRAQALRRRGIPNWGVFGRKDLQGGGPMIDIGVHVLEMAHFMMGSPRPISASGNTWTFLGHKPSEVHSMWPGWDHKTYTVEDMAAGIIRFENGSLLTIEASFVAHIAEDVWNVNLLGEKGGANWDRGEIFKDQDGYMMNLKPGYLSDYDMFDKKMRHFVEVCRDGRTSEATPEHGVMVQKMLDGIYASAEAGKEVEIE